MGARDIADPRQIDTEYVLEKEEKGGESLRLCRGRNVAARGQVGKKGFDTAVAKVSRALALVEFNETRDPADILLFGSITIVTLTYFGSDLIQERKVAGMLHKHSAAFDDSAARVLY